MNFIIHVDFSILFMNRFELVLYKNMGLKKTLGETYVNRMEDWPSVNTHVIKDNTRI